MDKEDAKAPDQSSEAGEPVALPYLSPWRPLRRLSLEGVAVVACRALALWALVQVVESLTYAIFVLAVSVTSSPMQFLKYSGSSELILLLHPLVFAAIAGMLWFKAGWLAERMTRLVPADPMPEGSSTAHERAKTPVEDALPLLGVLLTVAGVIVLASAVPELGQALTVPLFLRVRDEAHDWVSSVLGSQLFWPAIVKCAIGIWLLLGHRGIARLVLKLRRPDPPLVRDDIDPAEGADGPL